jgi:hypothetical protein
MHIETAFIVRHSYRTLRQRLLVLHRSSNRPRLRHRDRLFWIALSQLWRDWRSIIVIVKPETVIKWHRQGFKCYWRWKSRSGRVGRPRTDQEFTCLAMRLRNQQLRSIEAAVASHLRKHGRAFFGIMLIRARQLIFSPCLLRLSMSCTASSYCCTIGGRWSTSM